MARLRRDTLPLPAPPPLRIFATGTVFLTHSLLLHSHPNPGTVNRAQSVYTSRGGAAAHVLALLAQLAATVPAAGDVEPMLIASLGGNIDAVRLREALEAVGVRTKYCKIWPGLGVPSAWVVHARDTDVRTVINHNPLPEVSHEDFIAILGPVLAPENFVGFNPPPAAIPPPIPREQQSPSPVSIFPNTLAPSAPRPSMSSRPQTAPTASNPPPPCSVPSQNPNSPAPFDWVHFEGRNVRTTIANLVGIDGLARERKWRSHCVVSVDLGRRAREGVEVLIPHADVIFLSATTFPSPSQPGTPSPRVILLSLARLAPPHALLVLNAGRDGAALLSLPTSEYLQSSGWAHIPPTPTTFHQPVPHPGIHGHTASATSNGTRTTRTWDGIESVRSASDFWAGGTPDASFGSRESAYTQRGSERSERSHRHLPSGESFHPMDDDDEDEEPEQGGGEGDGEGDGEDGRQTPQPQERTRDEEALDEEGAHAAFVAGMIWALSRRVLPGQPYVPTVSPDAEAKAKDGGADLGLRWRLDECLRFATELACRKAHSRAEDMGTPSVATSGPVKERGEWDGLGEAMRMAGWFD